MLQLQELNWIKNLTGIEPYELKTLSFGFSVLYTGTTAQVIASQWVGQDEALLVTRVTCYLTDIDNTQGDYLLYRMPPDGAAWWILGLTVSDIAGVYNVTTPN